MLHTENLYCAIMFGFRRSSHIYFIIRIHIVLLLTSTEGLQQHVLQSLDYLTKTTHKD